MKFLLSLILSGVLVLLMNRSMSHIPEANTNASNPNTSEADNSSYLNSENSSLALLQPYSVNNIFKKMTLPYELRVSLSDTGSLYDETVIVFRPGATDFFDTQYDAYKLGYLYGSIGSFTTESSTLLSINCIAPLDTTSSDTIPLSVALNNSALTYHLNFTQLSSFPSNVKIYLWDKFLNVTNDVRVYPTYTFTTSAEQASFTDTRFELYFGNLGPVPVNMISCEANKNGKNVDLKWATSSEINNDRFEIEFSRDNMNFEKAGEVKGAGNSTSIQKYYFKHAGILDGRNVYYRLKQIDRNGEFSYTGVMIVEDKTNDLSVSVYPTPASDVLNINYLKNGNRQYTVIVKDLSGRIVKELKGSPKSIDLNNYRNGTYLLYFSDEKDGIVQIQKMIVVK